MGHGGQFCPSGEGRAHGGQSSRTTPQTLMHTNPRVREKESSTGLRGPPTPVVPLPKRRPREGRGHDWAPQAVAEPGLKPGPRPLVLGPQTSRSPSSRLLP